jgi:ribonucleotide reductase alpha subunit
MVQPELSANAIRVLEARYLLRGAERQVVETPQQLFERTARAIAHAETLNGNPGQARYWEEQFYEMLTSLDFLPNSPTLMNAGTPLGQLSACFVLPVEDTIEGIFEAVKEMALITRTGGGIGGADPLGIDPPRHDVGCKYDDIPHAGHTRFGGRGPHESPRHDPRQLAVATCAGAANTNPGGETP